MRGRLCKGYLKMMGLNSEGSSPIISPYLYTKDYVVLISMGSSSPLSYFQAKGLIFLFFSWFLELICKDGSSLCTCSYLNTRFLSILGKNCDYFLANLLLELIGKGSSSSFFPQLLELICKGSSFTS